MDVGTYAWLQQDSAALLSDSISSNFLEGNSNAICLFILDQPEASYDRYYDPLSFYADVCHTTL